MRIKGNSKPRGNSWCGGEERRGEEPTGTVTLTAGLVP